MHVMLKRNVKTEVTKFCKLKLEDRGGWGKNVQTLAGLRSRISPEQLKHLKSDDNVI